jgi:glycosyltransferase involved in cell wall biosynthesis
MRDERNLSSPYEQYFVGNRSYAGKECKLANALSFVHSPDAVINISRLIKERKPDLMHCHNIYHQLTPSIIGAAKRAGIPVVLTLHDSKLVCPSYYRLREGKPCSTCIDGDFFNVVQHRCAGGSLGKSLLLYTEAVVQQYLGNYEKVDTFIAPSKFMQESIAHRIPTERIKLLYNGVDTNEIRESGADDGYVLFLGRLVREKGIETLLKAHSKSSMRWSIVVAGTGPLSDALKTEYNTCNFVGHIVGKALRQIIDRAAVVVVPSECYENCPMAVIEAMAYGKTVVGSRMGGIPELIEHNITGMLFDAGKVDDLAVILDILMSTPELRKKMGREARKRVVSEFSLSQHNTGLVDIYQSILGV